MISLLAAAYFCVMAYLASTHGNKKRANFALFFVWVNVMIYLATEVFK